MLSDETKKAAGTSVLPTQEASKKIHFNIIDKGQ